MYTKHETCIVRDADQACIPLDPDNADYAAYLAWLDEGNAPADPSAPTFEQRAAMLLASVDDHLNAAARAKGYDSIINAALRAALPASPFHDEGVAFGTWMDQVYAKCYRVLADVTSGESAEPAAEQLIAMLPELQLPS